MFRTLIQKVLVISEAVYVRYTVPIHFTERMAQLGYDWRIPDQRIRRVCSYAYEQTNIRSGTYRSTRVSWRYGARPSGGRSSSHSSLYPA